MKALRGFTRCRPAVTGGDRIDENEIRFVQPARGVIDQMVRGGRTGTRFRKLDPAWSEGTQVEPDRSRARSTVEGKGNRPSGQIRLIPSVRDKEYLRLRFQGIVARRRFAAL